MYTIKNNTTDQMAHDILGLANYVKELTDQYEPGDAPQVVYRALDFLATVVVDNTQG